MRHVTNFLLTASLATGLFVIGAQAVVIDVTIETEGEPVPNAVITFETEEGEPIDLALLEEEVAEKEDGKAIEEQLPEDPAPASDGNAENVSTPNDDASEIASDPSEPVSTPATTDQEGKLKVAVADALTGQSIVVVVRQGEKIVKRQELTPSEETSSHTIEAFDPADAMISVAITQKDEKCTRGKNCAFELSLRNDGNGIYEGPAFFDGILIGNWLSALSSMEDFYCGPARRGKVLCQTDVSLEPGQSRTLDAVVPLPRKISKSSRSCIQSVEPAKAVATKSKPLVSVLQLGLAKAGFKPGKADGLDGPKTQAAITSFIEAQGKEDTPSNEQLFEMLYQYPLSKLARLGVSNQSHCYALALTKPVVNVTKPKQKKIKRTKKTRKKVTKQSRVTKTHKASGKRKISKDKIRKAVGIGVTIGIGVGIMKGLKKKKHHRPHYPEH